MSNHLYETLIELAKENEALRVEISELKRKNASLTESNQSLSDFAYTASHDLQEPLRKIEIFGELLKSGLGEIMDGHEKPNLYLSRIFNAANRMRILINSLLEYSRVTTSDAPFSEVNLNDSIREVLADLDTVLTETEGEIQLDPLPVIEADPFQIRQLFLNLIGNSLKFRKPQERPFIKIYADSPAKESGRHSIYLEDNGIGFDEKHLDRIFDPFHRLHGKESAYGGTGVGLAICKKVMDRHKGSITARSAPGKGSTFIITLPVDPSKARE